MSKPRLLVDLDRIAHNARMAKAVGRAHGMEVMGVTKGAAGLPEVAESMLAGGIETLGDSRLENIERIRKAGIKAHTTLLRSPGLSDIVRTVELSEASLNADLEAVAAISDAACAQNKIHGVVLMVDLDTGREGFAAEEIPGFAAGWRRFRAWGLQGLGPIFTWQANAACT